MNFLYPATQFIRKDHRRKQKSGARFFATLAPTTRAIRQSLGFKGTKALFVRGDLRQSVVVVLADGVIVGVMRSAQGKEGQRW